MKNPFFSIIIPTFNGERFIERTLNSVLKQTYRDFELIIIDDGSNDRTADILNKYKEKDGRIKVITTPNSGGPTVPTNIGITLAQGGYVTFLDHDDEWRSHKLQLLHDFFVENPTIGFVASNVEHIHDKTARITPAKLQLIDGNLPKKDVLAGNYFNTFSMLAVKRSVLDKVGSLDTNLKVFADFDIVSRMLAHDIPYQFLSDILVTYHLHDNNTSSLETSANQRIKDLKRIITKYEKTFRAFPEAYSNVLHAIARLHLHVKEQKEAIFHFKKAIAVHPRKLSNYARLAMAYLGEKPYQAMKKIRNRAGRVIR